MSRDNRLDSIKGVLIIFISNIPGGFPFLFALFRRFRWLFLCFCAYFLLSLHGRSLDRGARNVIFLQAGMANNFFRFKQFTVYQDRCAMKVGTDGALLGAWAQGGASILDVGTGTGVVALMMAQRFPMATVHAVEVDPLAAGQANENVVASPFADRVAVQLASLQQWAADESNGARYDAVVANPPYFQQALRCPDGSRSMARHDVSLSYDDLFACTARLLTPTGVFTVVIPFDCLEALLKASREHGFHLFRRCDVRTTPRKAPRRHLLSFSLQPPTSPCLLEQGVIEDAPGHRSPWYASLLRDFYL